MIGKIFAVLSALGVLGAVTGASEGGFAALTDAVLDSAAAAVTLTVSLLGMLCLWSGVLRVLEEAGVTAGLARLLRPLLARLFPTAARTGRGLEAIAANISANLLGMGNAATPFALSAMEEMQRDNEDKTSASDDMVTFTVMNCVSLTVLPTTLITLRRAAGSASPTAFLPAVWAASLLSAVIGVLLARLFRSAFRGKRGKRGKRGDLP